MTPALYMRGAMRAAIAIFTSSCPLVGSVLDIGLYPLLDYNFYKAMHCAVNAALHLVVALPIITVHRCVRPPARARLSACALPARCPRAARARPR